MWPPSSTNSLGKDNLFQVFEEAILNPFGTSEGDVLNNFEDDSLQSAPISMPSVIESDTPIPLPHLKQESSDTLLTACNDFELDDDSQGLLLSDNAPLFMKLRQSERNRRAKMKASSTSFQEQIKAPKKESNNEKDFTYSDGFFGPVMMIEEVIMLMLFVGS